MGRRGALGPAADARLARAMDAQLARAAKLIDALAARQAAGPGGEGAEGARASSVMLSALQLHVARAAMHAPPSALLPGGGTVLTTLGRALNLLPLPSDMPPKQLATPPDLQNLDDAPAENEDTPFEPGPPTPPPMMFHFAPAQHKPYPPKSDSETQRITLSKACEAPTNETATAWHGTRELRFFAMVTIVDADEPERVFTFDLTEPSEYVSHGACFNIGVGHDGSPLISYSSVRAFYQLPDGSMWAEHEDLYDSEDLAALAEQVGNPALKQAFRTPPGVSLPEACTRDQQLARRRGRFHSRLEAVEEELWVYDRDEFARRVAEGKLGGHVTSTYWYHLEGPEVEVCMRKETESASPPDAKRQKSD